MAGGVLRNRSRLQDEPGRPTQHKATSVAPVHAQGTAKVTMEAPLPLVAAWESSKPLPPPGGGLQGGAECPPLGGSGGPGAQGGPGMQELGAWDGRERGAQSSDPAPVVHACSQSLGWAGLGGAAGTTSSSHSCWAAGAGRPPGRGPSRCCRGWSWVPGTHSSSRRWSPRGARRPVSR